MSGGDGGDGGDGGVRGEWKRVGCVGGGEKNESGGVKGRGEGGRE